jgi:hypothetical protein
MSGPPAWWVSLGVALALLAAYGLIIGVLFVVTHAPA